MGKKLRNAGKGGGRGRARRSEGRGVGCSKGVDYLRCNGVPGLCCLPPLCQVGGSRVRRQFAFICGFPRTPPFHGSPRDARYASPTCCFTLAPPPPTPRTCWFLRRDIISGSVTESRDSRRLFRYVERTVIGIDGVRSFPCAGLLFELTRN